MGCNDLYVFFEPDEITRLSTETIVGSFVNPDHSLAKLKARVTETLDDFIKVKASKKDANTWEEVSLEIRGLVYRQFIRDKKYGAHVYPGHINLVNTSNLDHGDNFTYQGLLLQVNE